MNKLKIEKNIRENITKTKKIKEEKSLISSEDTKKVDDKNSYKNTGDFKSNNFENTKTRNSFKNDNFAKKERREEREEKKEIKNKLNIKTHWGNVAESYDKHLATDGTYHSEVIWPNLKRIITSSFKNISKENSKDIKDSKSESLDFKSKKILDIACGQGYFSELLAAEGAHVQAFDLGEGLIKIAKENTKNNSKDLSFKNIDYIVADAQDFSKNYSSKIFDIVICVLAIQNIENVKLTLENIKKITDKNSKVYFVINHPAYRIPKYSEWGYSQNGIGKENKSLQYRRVDKYMSEDKIKMDMTPSERQERDKVYTYSYHRPLQYYFKLFNNNKFAVTRLEEWVSNKVSDGKYADRENTARKEFPMFMCLEIINI